MLMERDGNQSVPTAPRKRRANAAAHQPSDAMQAVDGDDGTPSEGAVSRVRLAAAVYQNARLSRREALRLVGEVLDEISTCLVQGEDVLLSGFGKFEVRNKNTREGRNPKTGKPATIEARRTIVFRASKIMRKRIARAPQP